jgi:hypothetical protein
LSYCGYYLRIYTRVCGCCSLARLPWCDLFLPSRHSLTRLVCILYRIKCISVGTRLVFGGLLLSLSMCRTLLECLCCCAVGTRRCALSLLLHALLTSPLGTSLCVVSTITAHCVVTCVVCVLLNISRAQVWEHVASHCGPSFLVCVERC